MCLVDSRIIALDVKQDPFPDLLQDIGGRRGVGPTGTLFLGVGTPHYLKLGPVCTLGYSHWSPTTTTDVRMRPQSESGRVKQQAPQPHHYRALTGTSTGLLISDGTRLLMRIGHSGVGSAVSVPGGQP